MARPLSETSWLMYRWRSASPWGESGVVNRVPTIPCRPSFAASSDGRRITSYAASVTVPRTRLPVTRATISATRRQASGRRALSRWAEPHHARAGEPRHGPPRTRKKYGAYPFARLSLASAQHLVEDAVGRLQATAKRIAAGRREETEPEGSPAKSPDGCPFPRPKLGGSDESPHVWAAQFSRRRSASGPSATRRPQTDFGF